MMRFCYNPVTLVSRHSNNTSITTNTFNFTSLFVALVNTTYLATTSTTSESNENETSIDAENELGNDANLVNCKTIINMSSNNSTIETICTITNATVETCEKKNMYPVEESNAICTMNSLFVETCEITDDNRSLKNIICINIAKLMSANKNSYETKMCDAKRDNDACGKKIKNIIIRGIEGITKKMIALIPYNEEIANIKTIIRNTICYSLKKSYGAILFCLFFQIIRRVFVIDIKNNHLQNNRNKSCNNTICLIS